MGQGSTSEIREHYGSWSSKQIYNNPTKKVIYPFNSDGYEQSLDIQVDGEGITARRNAYNAKGIPSFETHVDKQGKLNVIVNIPGQSSKTYIEGKNFGSARTAEEFAESMRALVSGVQ